MSDTYQTLSSAVAEGYYTDRRSKFYAFAHHVETTAEVRDIVAKYRRRYHDARHVCYAYRIGVDGVGEGVADRMNDDGEPSSTAGRPIHGQIVKAGLTNALVVVVRYYGGVNLGTPGLIAAYRSAAAESLAAAETEQRLIEERVDFSFAYPQLNDVMKIVRDMQPRIVSQTFDNTCTMSLAIRRALAQQLKDRLEALAFK